MSQQVQFKYLSNQYKNERKTAYEQSLRLYYVFERNVVRSSCEDEFQWWLSRGQSKWRTIQNGRLKMQWNSSLLYQFYGTVFSLVFTFK